MIDVLLGYCLLLAAIPISLISNLFRIRPRLLPGEELRFVDLETLQNEYKGRYPIRLVLLRILPPILTIYYGVRILLWPTTETATGPNIISAALTIAAIYVATLIVVMATRIYHERKFVAAHPAFADSLLPIPPRVLFILPTVVSLALLALAMTAPDSTVKICMAAAAIVCIFLGQKLRKRQITHSRYEFQWDEPLGNRIAEVVEQFGFQPKKLILLPSLISNAYATPDGSVVVTSALRTIATPSEIAAVVAHELSHVKDREGKKWERYRSLAILPIAFLISSSFVFGSYKPYEALVPCLVGFGSMTLFIGSTWWVTGRTRPREFKADAEAAQIGLGPDLASCLDKLTRFMGVPPRWIGVDRYLITHPSLEERVARLRQS